MEFDFHPYYEPRRSEGWKIAAAMVGMLLFVAAFVSVLVYTPLGEGQIGRNASAEAYENGVAANEEAIAALEDAKAAARDAERDAENLLKELEPAN